VSFLSIFDAVTPVVNKILDFIHDPQQKLQAQQELMQSLSQWDSQQTAIDVEEAKSNSMFVAGARPFILWVCGFAVAYKFVLQPFLVFVIVACHIEFDVKLLPSIDWPELSSLMFGMLGLSGMRTWEKMAK
jgi:hypothetical protein